MILKRWRTESFTQLRLHSQQVKLLGLAALDDEALPFIIQTLKKLADRGMHVAALTPEHFAQWLAEVMQ